MQNTAAPPSDLARQRGADWLARAALRPTRQRVTLAALLVGDGQDRHVTAEALHAAARAAGAPCSLATVYNTLHHHHFYVEGQNELLDIPGAEVMVDRMPSPPEGFEIARVDVVVRLRRKPQS